MNAAEWAPEWGNPRGMTEHTAGRRGEGPGRPRGFFVSQSIFCKVSSTLHGVHLIFVLV